LPGPPLPPPTATEPSEELIPKPDKALSNIAAPASDIIEITRIYYLNIIILGVPPPSDGILFDESPNHSIMNA
jgi:hypothetical protein